MLLEDEGSNVQGSTGRPTPGTVRQRPSTERALGGARARMDGSLHFMLTKNKGLTMPGRVVKRVRALDFPRRLSRDEAAASLMMLRKESRI